MLVTRFGVLRVLPSTLALGAVAYAGIGWSAPSLGAVMVSEGLFGLLLGCGSSGLIAVSAITYPIAIRSTGIGWATGIGRLGSVAGPLAVGQMAGAQWDVPTIFLTAGASVLIGAAASALMGLLSRADTEDASVAVAPASQNA
jgi:AAHS family 4-hydroxybenzoate transporter-like MFS transporter